VLALDESGVGGELLNAREATDVMDLVEQCHAEDAADARHREQESEGVGILHSGLGE
jgi:hypothetical protein